MLAVHQTLPPQAKGLARETMMEQDYGTIYLYIFLLLRTPRTTTVLRDPCLVEYVDFY